MYSKTTHTQSPTTELLSKPFQLLARYGTQPALIAAQNAFMSATGCSLSVDATETTLHFTLELSEIKSASRKRVDTDAAIIAREGRFDALTGAQWMSLQKNGLLWVLKIELPQVDFEQIGGRLGIVNFEQTVKTAAEQVFKSRGRIDKRWARVYQPWEIADLIKKLVVEFDRFDETKITDDLIQGWVRKGGWSNYKDGDRIDLMIGETKTDLAHSELLGERLYLSAQITR